MVADYQTIRLSLKGHPMEFLREMFTRERIVACKDINHDNERRRVRCAGVVLVRQRPGSASGVVFMTLEDETGIANIVVWPKIMEQYRKEVMGARLILVEGYIQSSPEKVTHLIAQRMIDRSHDLVGLANDALGRKHPVPAGAALIEPLNDDPPRPPGCARAKTSATPATSASCRRRGIFIEDVAPRCSHATSRSCPAKTLGHSQRVTSAAHLRLSPAEASSSAATGFASRLGYGSPMTSDEASKNSPGSRSRRPRPDWSLW